MEADSQPNRVALIIVGRPSHGKSSFCKMLASDEEKNNVKFDALSECHIYKSNHFEDIYGKSLYLIDTPNFDSKTKKLEPLAKKIIDFTIQEKLSIVGIAYVLKINKDPQSEVTFKLLELLKAQYSEKKNNFFCVLSHFDSWYSEDPQSNLKAFKTHQIQFQKAQFQNTWNRKICWMSQPEKQLQFFKFRIERTELKKLFQRQLPNLKELLRNIQKKNKRALIVVGRMGHGKSAFCKMLVSQQQKQKIRVQKSIQSVTTICSMFRSNKFKDIYDDDLYIIDSPGLDSRDAAYMIIQQIDSLIFEEQLSIVGIAYVTDIGQREMNEAAGNFIFTFFEILRIKYSYKNNLSLCVFTKWDKHYEQQEANEKIFFQMEEEFQKIEFKDAWHRKLYWISEPSKDIKKFKKKIQDPELQNLYSNQLEYLKSFLYFFKKNNLILPYKAFQADRIDFQKVHIKKLMEEYENFQFKTQLFNIQLNIHMLEQQNSNQANPIISGLTAAGIVGIVTGSTILSIDAALLETGAVIGVTAGFAVAAIAFVVVGSLMALGGISYGIYRLVRHLSREKLNKMLLAASKITVEQLIRKKMDLTRKKVIFREEIFILDVKGQDYLGQKIKFQKKQGYFVADAPRAGTTAKFRFTCKAPTIDCYKEFIERITKQYFNE